MYTTIDIGDPRMTCDFLEGNLHTLVDTSCNADSRVQYMSCNEDSHVRNSTLRKRYSKLV